MLTDIVRMFHKSQGLLPMIVQMWMAQGAPWLKDKVDSSGQKYYIVIDWNMQMKSVGPPYGYVQIWYV